MPTDQRLDDAAEERNRIRCRHAGVHMDNTDCFYCWIQRAAIKADREARPFRAEHRPQCLKHSCDLTSTIIDKWFCAVCEAALADRLAEALDGLIVGEPTCTPDDACFNECRTNWSERLEVASSVLREHEERRR